MLWLPDFIKKKRGHEPPACILTLKLLPWLCISTTFDSISTPKCRKCRPERKKQRHHCSLYHNASDGLFRSYLRVNQVSRQVLLLVWRINACPFLNRETIGTYQLLHFLQHLSSSFFFGNLKKMHFQENKFERWYFFFMTSKLFLICLPIFVRG